MARLLRHQAAQHNCRVYQRFCLRADRSWVLREIRRLNPVDHATGHRKDYHHQWFSEDKGHPKLRAHIEAVTALMKASPNWGKYRSNLQRAYPAKDDNFMFAFMDDE